MVDLLHQRQQVLVEIPPLLVQLVVHFLTLKDILEEAGSVAVAVLVVLETVDHLSLAVLVFKF